LEPSKFENVFILIFHVYFISIGAFCIKYFVDTSAQISVFKNTIRSFMDFFSEKSCPVEVTLQ